MAETTAPITAPSGDKARIAESLDRCDIDPLSDWMADLIQDAYAGRSPSWPVRSKGLQLLLTASSMTPGKTSNPSASLALHEALRRRRGRHANAPRAAIRVHSDLDGLISAAQGILCTYGWFLEPSSAIFICADQGEAAEIEALLRRDDDLERGEDLLDSGLWVAEELMSPSPGWRSASPARVLLAGEVLPENRWREVFLSPGCRVLKADQLLRAIATAEVGVHVLGATTAP